MSKNLKGTSLNTSKSNWPATSTRTTVVHETKASSRNDIYLTELFNPSSICEK